MIDHELFHGEDPFFAIYSQEFPLTGSLEPFLLRDMKYRSIMYNLPTRITEDAGFGEGHLRSQAVGLSNCPPSIVITISLFC